MKKFFAISFLCIYLFSTTNLHQLLKAPLLIEHYIEHREKNQGITIWQFLYLHYAMGDIMDADFEKDMKLPFKSHDTCVSVVSNFVVSLPETFSVPQLKPILEEQNFSIQDEFLRTSFLSNIWQPPRTS